MVEEVEDLTEAAEVEAAGLEVVEGLDGAAAEVVLIGNKITVHQNTLLVSPRTTDIKEATNALYLVVHSGITLNGTICCLCVVL